jgi:argininosuccinate synthase
MIEKAKYCTALEQKFMNICWDNGVPFSLNQSREENMKIITQLNHKKKKKEEK